MLPSKPADRQWRHWVRRSRGRPSSGTRQGLSREQAWESRPERATFDSIAGVPSIERPAVCSGHVRRRNSFPTFGMQSLRFEGHAVVTSRRHHAAATLGVPRRLRDDLDARSPLAGRRPADLLRRTLQHSDRALAAAIVGSPVVTLRDAFGGAAVGRFPTIHQAIGVRLSLSLAYVEVHDRSGDAAASRRLWLQLRRAESVSAVCGTSESRSTFQDVNLAAVSAHSDRAQRMKTLAVIPARLGATRLPRKPLRLLAGVPLIVRVWQRVRRYRRRGPRRRRDRQ